MKSIYNKIGAGLLGMLLLTACQDRDLPGSGEMQIASPEVSQITGALNGENNYDYTLTWPASNNGAVMNVAVYKNGTQQQALTPCPSGSFTLKNLETNQLYEFLFKYANDEAISNGVMTSYTRLGATTPSEVKMDQVDITDDQHNLQISWTASPDATSYILKVVKNSTEEVVNTTVNGTSYLLEGVQMKDRFEATVIAQNRTVFVLSIDLAAHLIAKRERIGLNGHVTILCCASIVGDR